MPLASEAMWWSCNNVAGLGFVTINNNLYCIFCIRGSNAKIGQNTFFFENYNYYNKLHRLYFGLSWKIWFPEISADTFTSEMIKYQITINADISLHNVTENAPRTHNKGPLMEASCSQTHVFFHCQTQKSPRRQHTEPPHSQRSQSLNRAAAARQCVCSRERVPNRQQKKVIISHQGHTGCLC